MSRTTKKRAAGTNVENCPADISAIADWMESNIGVSTARIEVKKFAGGQSNPTFKVDCEGGAFVLRTKPQGPTLKGAHAVDREARVQKALRTTGFPVPEIYGFCDDESLIGSPFYMMEMVEGRIFWDACLPEIDPSLRASYYSELVQVLARLHTVDFEQIGLNDYGPTGAYVARQLFRWVSQYKDDEVAGRNEHMDRLADWLPFNVPDDDETCLIHGDFRLDNVIFHPTECRILSVLDWELSTLGNPIADFAYHLMMYRLPSSLVAGLRGVDLKANSLPSERDYVAQYKMISQRKSLPHLDYYVTFNLFRFAAIVHGIKGRAIRGNATSDQASRLIGLLPEIARIACEQIDLA